jgi:hypothetical protein
LQRDVVGQMAAQQSGSSAVVGNNEDLGTAGRAGILTAISEV